jgi:hypothetical protein
MIISRTFSRNINSAILVLSVLLSAVFISGASATVATSSTSTLITANLSSVLFLSSSNCGSACNLNFTPTGTGTYCTVYDNLSYFTNNSGGYNLYISDNSSSTAALIGASTIPSTATVSGGGSASALSSANTWGYSAYPDPYSLSSTKGVKFGSTVNAPTNYPSGVTLGTIPDVTTGLQTTATTGTSSCGTSSLTGSPTFAGIPLYSAPQVINYSASQVATTYSTVFYGIYANTAKPSGAYTTTVVYTIVTT